jgi:hypothetical protein
MNDPSGGPIHVELPVSGAKRTTFSRTREGSSPRTMATCSQVAIVPEYRVQGGWTKAFTACPTDRRGSLQARALCRLHDHL